MWSSRSCWINPAIFCRLFPLPLQVSLVMLFPALAKRMRSCVLKQAHSSHPALPVGEMLLKYIPQTNMVATIKSVLFCCNSFKKHHHFTTALLWRCGPLRSGSLRSSSPGSLETLWGKNIPFLTSSEKNEESQGQRDFSTMQVALHIKDNFVVVVYYYYFTIVKLKVGENSCSPSIPTMSQHRNTSSSSTPGTSTGTQSSWAWARRIPNAAHTSLFTASDRWVDLRGRRQPQGTSFCAKALVCTKHCPRQQGDNCEFILAGVQRMLTEPQRCSSSRWCSNGQLLR